MDMLSSASVSDAYAVHRPGACAVNSAPSGRCWRWRRARARRGRDSRSRVGPDHRRRLGGGDRSRSRPRHRPGCGIPTRWPSPPTSCWCASRRPGPVRTPPGAAREHRERLRPSAVQPLARPRRPPAADDHGPAGAVERRDLGLLVACLSVLLFAIAVTLIPPASPPARNSFTPRAGARSCARARRHPGAAEARIDGAAVDLGTRKQRALLAALAMRRENRWARTPSWTSCGARPHRRP